MAKKKVAILGSGVIGLTCADVLQGDFDVTIITKQRVPPTSRAAAAIWFPHAVEGPRVLEWADATRKRLDELMKHETETGLRLVDFTFLGKKNPPLRVPFLEYHAVAPPEGFTYANVIRVHLIDTSIYLPFLWKRVQELDVREIIVTRPMLEDLAREFALIVNCTGYESKKLWRDTSLKPGRGVTLSIPRPEFDGACVYEEELRTLMYVIPRTTDCILGGVEEEVERWTTDDEELTGIVARCVAATKLPWPSTKPEAYVGIRPKRNPVRLEQDPNDKKVVHCYGHGGAGFTVSWGCAEDLASLVRDIVA